LRVYRDADRVLVEGVNRVMRHQKALPGAGTQNQAGGIINREAPIHISNVTKVDSDKKVDKAAAKADKKAAKAAEKSEKKTAKATEEDEKKTADAVDGEDES
jgi:large subunit ribosomal protein L24